MEHLQFQLGRLVTSIGDTVLPSNVASAISNVDIEEPGAVSRRRGFQRAVDTPMSGRVALVVGFEDTDGTDLFVVADATGLRREI